MLRPARGIDRSTQELLYLTHDYSSILFAFNVSTALILLKFRRDTTEPADWDL